LAEGVGFGHPYSPDGKSLDPASLDISGSGIRIQHIPDSYFGGRCGIRSPVFA